MSTGANMAQPGYETSLLRAEETSTSTWSDPSRSGPQATCAWSQFTEEEQEQEQEETEEVQADKVHVQ